jgi:hypothetical protein
MLQISTTQNVVWGSFERKTEKHEVSCYYAKKKKKRILDTVFHRGKVRHCLPRGSQSQAVLGRTSDLAGEIVTAG